ncbi:MAG: hypothetical protein GXO23_03095 [Crenarchaeota archaeon]|nr:hypothetical protein [Thermoproteota archaeon]
MKFEGKFKVVRVEIMPDYPSLKALYMVDDSGREMYLEYPEEILKIKVNEGDTLYISIDHQKDERYRENWDVYMWGRIYYRDGSRTRISIGGLILELKSPDNLGEVGDKVYVGIRMRER